jgi:hypothetical protein
MPLDREPAVLQFLQSLADGDRAHSESPDQLPLDKSLARLELAAYDVPLQDLHNFDAQRFGPARPLARG